MNILSFISSVIQNLHEYTVKKLSSIIRFRWTETQTEILHQHSYPTPRETRRQVYPWHGIIIIIVKKGSWGLASVTFSGTGDSIRPALLVVLRLQIFNLSQLFEYQFQNKTIADSSQNGPNFWFKLVFKFILIYLLCRLFAKINFPDWVEFCQAGDRGRGRLWKGKITQSSAVQST